MLIPHCHLTSAALPIANPNLTITALPIALLLTSTTSPAVITVYRVDVGIL